MTRGHRAAVAAGVAALGVVAALGTGCRWSKPSTDRDVLTLAVRADVTGFFPNPPLANEAFTLHVNRNVFEGLVGWDRRLHIEPALAERWENPDERTYVFELRPDLRFSDGRAVTAADVAASLTAARERGWVTRDYLQAIESVRALGPRRVEIRTRGPYMILLFKLPWGFVVPKGTVHSTPVPAVGTGPYRLESWKPGRETLLSRNAHFRGPPPYFERVRFVVVPDFETRIGMVARGEADIADHVPLERVAALSTRPDLKVLARQGLRVLFLALRVDSPPLSDPRVREAIDLAIDRDELIRRALAGQTVPASQLVPPAVVGHNPHIRVTRADPLRARKLLAEAGYTEGMEIRLDGTDNRYVNDREILQEVARQLAAVGIQARVNAMDKRDLFPLVNRGGSKLALLGWACESGDAADMLDSILHSPGEDSLGSFNSLGLSDPELDRIIDESNRTLDPAKRTARLQAAMTRAAALRATIPLVIQTEAIALSRRIDWDPPLSFGFELSDVRRAGTSPKSLADALPN